MQTREPGHRLESERRIMFKRRNRQTQKKKKKLKTKHKKAKLQRHQIEHMHTHSMCHMYTAKSELANGIERERNGIRR